MKRSLVMLLVVALLAMMIPSIAMADEPEQAKPTLTLSTDKATEYLSSSVDWDYSTDLDITFSTTGLTIQGEYSTDYKRGRITLTSSDDTIVSTNNSTSFYGDVTDEELPSVKIHRKEGTAKITVTLQDYYNDEFYAIKEIIVTVKKAKTEKIEVDPDAKDTDFEMTLDDDVKPFSNFFKSTPTYAYYAYDYKWSVDKPEIAKVDKWGNVYPLKVGTVTLTATAKDNADAKASHAITIKEGKKPEEEKAPTLSFSTSAFTVKTSDNLDLDNYLLVENPVAGDSIIWTSSDPKVANVDQYDGDLYPYKPGTVTITARSKKFPDAKAQCTVTVEKEPLKKISFSSVPTSMYYNDDISIWRYVNTDPTYYADEYKYRQEIGWTSSDPQVAYVDGDGDLSGVKPGTATITAYYKDDETVKASFTVEVKSVPVTAIAFSKSAYTVKAEGSIFLSSSNGKDYRLLPKDHSSDYTETWTSSDEDVASVSGGTVYGHKVGTATITLSIRNADESVVESSVNVTVTESPLTGIAFKKDAYSVPLSNRQNSKYVYLKVTPADADFDAYDLYTDSSDPQVATAEIYDYDGEIEVKLKAHKPGTATITVLSHSNAALSASTTVVVKPVNLTAVAMQTADKTVPLYDGTLANTITIKAIIKPSDAYCTATWQTTDAAVAYVINDEDNNGRSAELVAVGPGTCQIVLTATDGTNTMTATMNVTVKRAKIARLILNKSKATGYIIKDGDNTLQLTATDSKTDEPIPVTWTTSNKKVATVDSNGLVKFVAAGTAQITATTKDGNQTSKTCKVIVKKLSVTAVKPTKKTLTMKVGQEQTLTVKVKPAKAFNPAVSFKSSKPKIVSVDQEGNVKALAAGKAVITIKAKDGSKKSAKVTITVKAATKNNDGIEIGDGIDLSIDGDLMDGLNGIDGLDIGGDVADIEGDITNVTIG